MNSCRGEVEKIVGVEKFFVFIDFHHHCIYAQQQSRDGVLVPESALLDLHLDSLLCSSCQEQFKAGKPWDF